MRVQPVVSPVTVIIIQWSAVDASQHGLNVKVLEVHHNQLLPLWLNLLKK